jgi:hypothetical protein
MGFSNLERAWRYIAKCPLSISGQGGHAAAFHVAAVLVHGFGLGEGDGLMLLREWNRGCVPPWSEAELVHKIRSAMAAKHQEPHGYLLRDGKHATTGTNGRNGAKMTGAAPVLVRKPVFFPMVLKRVAAKAQGIGDVVAFVKHRSGVNPDCLGSVGVLRRLYPESSGERVLVFSDMKSQGQMVWTAASGFCDWHLPAGSDGVWFLAQPVDGKFHPNPRLDGKQSRRSEESVTAWRYAVLESDEADAGDWLRCLIQMPLRIASICESGGRSIHALVRIDAVSKVEWDARVKAIKPVLVTLGADPGALSAVRLTRLPQAWRGDRCQRLLYLNPTPDGTPILRQAARGDDVLRKRLERAA